jgi:UDP-N-acetylglucosamine--N-acetylmuramyl-(pentapeptide) pyrophosphoryl-undecaprenol N-acetylglucosamine transferase
MDTSEREYRIILSGGGTGGHIYPAVAVAEALRRMDGNVQILFVGAEGKMEMEKIPALGYDIVGLPVAGLQRKLSLANLALPFKVAKSLRKAKSVIADFKADIAAGFGGYASAPVLWSAQRMGLATVIQEQNSYAGVTNKILGRKADRVCVAYDGMDRFFPADKIVMTGNPLRGSVCGGQAARAEALRYFGLSGERPVLLILGGSLGTRTLNNMMKAWAERIADGADMDVIWQTGKYYSAEMTDFVNGRFGGRIWHGAFIDRMDYAYAAADAVVSRAGAITVSELCLTGKPVIFVPSPNVAEDHQTKNAMALVDKDAAIMIPDSEAVDRVIPTAMELLRDSALMAKLSAGIRKLAIADSAERVARIILSEIEKNHAVR